jgi:hypothetical protein
MRYIISHHHFPKKTLLVHILCELSSLAFPFDESVKTISQTFQSTILLSVCFAMAFDAINAKCEL